MYTGYFLTDSSYFLYQKESNLQQIKSFLRLRIPWSKLELATSLFPFGAENGEGQLIKNILHYTFLCVQTIGLLLPLLVVAYYIGICYSSDCPRFAQISCHQTHFSHLEGNIENRPWREERLLLFLV